MIPVQIPNLQDKELYEVLRHIALLAAQMSDVFAVGTTAQRPATGKRRFFWSTDDKQLFFYTGDATVGTAGWIIIG